MLYRVHLQQQRGAAADGMSVGAQVGAVDGADFAQLAAGLQHDVGQPERAADLNQLAARDDDFAPLRQGVEHDRCLSPLCQP